MIRAVTVLTLSILGFGNTHADTEMFKYVFIHPDGRLYTPNREAMQPTVSIITSYWGYDLQGGVDEEICIVVVEPISGDAPIDPPAGSFLIWTGNTYIDQTSYDSNSTCVQTGM